MTRYEISTLLYAAGCKHAKIDRDTVMLNFRESGIYVERIHNLTFYVLYNINDEMFLKSICGNYIIKKRKRKGDQAFVYTKPLFRILTFTLPSKCIVEYDSTDDIYKYIQYTDSIVLLFNIYKTNSTILSQLPKCLFLFFIKKYFL